MKDNQRRAMFANMNNLNTGRSTVKILNSPDRVNKFNRRVKVIRKNGVTDAEKRELTIIQRRARVMLTRKDLSVKERSDLKKIANSKINFSLFNLLGQASGSIKKVIAPLQVGTSKVRGAITDKKTEFAKGFKESGGLEAEAKVRKANIERLKKEEEFIESKREKELSELEDKKDLIATRERISKAKADISQAQMEERKAIMEEKNRESKRLAELKEANKIADRELFEQSVAGRIIKGTKIIGKKSVVAFNQFQKQQRSKGSVRRRKIIKKSLRIKKVNKRRKRKTNSLGFDF